MNRLTAGPGTVIRCSPRSHNIKTMSGSRVVKIKCSGCRSGSNLTCYFPAWLIFHFPIYARSQLGCIWPVHGQSSWLVSSRYLWVPRYTLRFLSSSLCQAFHHRHSRSSVDRESKAAYGNLSGPGYCTGGVGPLPSAASSLASEDQLSFVRWGLLLLAFYPFLPYLN